MWLLIKCINFTIKYYNTDLLLIFIVTIGVRRITRPIVELGRAAQEIAGGNFDQ